MMVFWGLVGIFGCMSHVSFEVTKPALVSIPSEVQRIAILNRVPDDTSETVLSIFLSESTRLKKPRFEIREPTAANSAYRKLNATLGKPLENNSVVTLCRDIDVDGLVALEGAKASGSWDMTPFTETETTTEEVTVDGKTEVREVSREVTRFRAEYTVSANAAWIFYGCKGNVLDKKTVRVQDSWIGEGDSRIDAKEDAGNTETILQDVHDILGRSYLQRISPYEVDISRSVYRNRKLKSGILALDLGKTEQAKQRFQDVAKASDGKQKGKALHNLAVAEEAAGEIEKAFEHAQRAVRITGKSNSMILKRALKQRLNEASQIEEQLSAPENPENSESPENSENPESPEGKIDADTQGPSKGQD